MSAALWPDVVACEDVEALWIRRGVDEVDAHAALVAWGIDPSAYLITPAPSLRPEVAMVRAPGEWIDGGLALWEAHDEDALDDAVIYCRATLELLEDVLA